MLLAVEGRLGPQDEALWKPDSLPPSLSLVSTKLFSVSILPSEYTGQKVTAPSSYSVQENNQTENTVS